MADYISREAAIAYIREQSEECQKAFEELGGENGIYADAITIWRRTFTAFPPPTLRRWCSAGTATNGKETLALPTARTDTVSSTILIQTGRISAATE